MIILIGGEKGGTGKSTIATNLAAIRAIAGKEVLLLDTDAQASATYWAALRDDLEGKVRVPCLRKTGNKIHRELAELNVKIRNDHHRCRRPGFWRASVIDAGCRPVFHSDSAQSVRCLDNRETRPAGG